MIKTILAVVGGVVVGSAVTVRAAYEIGEVYTKKTGRPNPVVEKISDGIMHLIFKDAERMSK